jgi:hypothetical protein
VAFVSHLRRAAVIGVAAAALLPASASARPVADTSARGQATQATAERLELGATVLAGGSVAVFVFGTIGMAAAADRRHVSAAR